MIRRQNFGMNSTNGSFNSRINQLNQLSMRNKLMRENNINTIKRKTLGLQSAREAILADLKKDIEKLDPNNGVLIRPYERKQEWKEYHKAYFNTILNDIVEANKERNKIDEWILIKNFLVLFYKIVTGKELFENTKPNYGYLLQKWLVVTKSLYDGVDVVDNTGKVIYTTPPLFIDSDEFKKFQKDALNSKARKIEEMNNWIQGLGLGNNQFDNYLNKKTSTSAYSEKREKYVKEWMDLFKRYYLLKDQEEEKRLDDNTDNDNTTKVEPVKKEVQVVSNFDDDIDMF